MESPDQNVRIKPVRWKQPLALVFFFLLFVYIALPYLLKAVGYRPLVFNESFFGHAHCIKISSGSFAVYANDHDGKFPVHTSGYGDALLLMWDEIGGSPEYLTGPCYSGKVFADARQNKTSVPESECGRVYVQGLTRDDDPKIAIFFDKQPTQGGDHAHGWQKLHEPLGREVITIFDGTKFILEERWPEFAKWQIELLVKKGIPRERAEALYAQKPKPLNY